MKKNYLFLSFTLVVLFLVLSTTNVTSNLTKPNAGSDGDNFANLTCVQNGCHPGPVVASTSSDLLLQIGTGAPTTTLDASFKYTPGTVYNIAFLIQDFASGNNPYYGFQISALDGATPTPNNAGALARVNTSNTSIDSILHRLYIGHLGASSNHNWTFKWTAPPCSTGPVTFYYAFNVASASTVPPSVPEGTIRTGNVTIQCITAGINDISDKLSDLNIFPNPVSNEFGLSFNLKQTDYVSTSVYSLDGKLSKQLMNEKVSSGNFNQAFDIQNLPAGIYLVKLNVGGAEVTEKIIKQ